MTPRIIPVELFDLVVFGATGDLSQRKLLPALFYRDLQGQIPPGSRIIGCSRRAMSNAEFIAFARAAIEDHVKEAERPADVMARFLERLSYVTVDAAQDAVKKTRGWLQTEQPQYWMAQIKQRQKKLDQAQSELMSARMSEFVESPTVQQMAVRMRGIEGIPGFGGWRTRGRWVHGNKKGQVFNLPFSRGTGI